jgi:hypothetical protein
VGSVTFDLTNTGSAEAFWGFFTASGSPVNLNVGDKLTFRDVQPHRHRRRTGHPVWGAELIGVEKYTNLTAGMNDGSFVTILVMALIFPSGATGVQQHSPADASYQRESVQHDRRLWRYPRSGAPSDRPWPTT